MRWALGFIQSGTPLQGPLQTSELEAAEKLLIKHVQAGSYPEEIETLRAGKPLKKSSSLLSLNPFMHADGLLRVGGRTGHHPVLVPSDHPVVHAIIRDYHARAHTGWEWTLSLIREKFWIVRGRAAVRRLLRACVKCKRLFAKPIPQIMADLPKERVTPNLPPFTNVGVDAFGPYQVRNYRSVHKRYGLVFTCMSTRAIHLELVQSMEAESFLNAFRRFVARRGLPKKVFSDNGTNFVKGEHDLRKAFLGHCKTILSLYGVDRGIEWSFIPPLAPHMGGTWERMVGIVKKILKGVLSCAVRLSDEVLMTLLCEVENIVNNRPLTKLSEDPNDLTPLTPNHLLLLRSGDRLPPGTGVASDAYRSRWKHVQHLADNFWQRWVKEYLPCLQRRSKWTKETGDISVGDMVLVVESNLPRNVWPLAIVTDIFTGRDGHVRSCLVKTRCAVLKRPITQLIRLEVD